MNSDKITPNSLLTQADLASVLKTSQQNISFLTRRGVLTPAPGTGGKGNGPVRYPLADNLQAFFAYRIERARGNETDLALQRARLRKAQQAAKWAQIKTAELTSNLVAVDALAEFVRLLTARIRQSMYEATERCGLPPDVKAEARTEIDRVLAELDGIDARRIRQISRDARRRELTGEDDE